LFGGSMIAAALGETDKRILEARDIQALGK